MTILSSRRYIAFELDGVLLSDLAPCLKGTGGVVEVDIALAYWVWMR